MLLEIYAKSDVGQKRKNNEDNFLVLDLTARYYWTASEGADLPAALHHLEDCEKGVVLIAADGLGGEVAGEVASGLAVETVREYMAAPLDTELTLGEHLRAAALQASQAVQTKGRDPAFHKLGSTFTGAAIQNGVLEFVQIGDSRAYLLRGDKIKQISKDQTLVQQLVDIGQISADEAERHPYKHVLIQALGTDSGVNPATGRIHLRRGDVVLLCSDGLSNKLEEEDLRLTIYAGESLAQTCEKLVAEANARGGEDNITVVLARALGEDLPAPDDERIMIERFGARDYDETTTMGGISMEELQATLPSFPTDPPLVG